VPHFIIVGVFSALFLWMAWVARNPLVKLLTGLPGLLLGYFALAEAVTEPWAWAIVIGLVLVYVFMTLLKRRARRRREAEDRNRTNGTTNNFFFGGPPQGPDV
tara:strand:- start:865 stop:1173 length:309 start_codon:yes stop_codon:yes gene_type:complete